MRMILTRSYSQRRLMHFLNDINPICQRGRHPTFGVLAALLISKRLKIVLVYVSIYLTV